MSLIKLFKRRSQAMRSSFPSYWSEFLRKNYDSAEEVASCYGVCFQTASNWWDGLHSPLGPYVAIAYEDHPLDAREFLSPRAA